MNIKTLKQIIKNGGATISTKTKKQVNYKTGFQVSFCDCYTIELTDLNDILNKINKLLKENQNNNNFVGLWVENNKIYIDLSNRIKRKNVALIFGALKNQISIFEWSTKNCIYIKKLA